MSNTLFHKPIDIEIEAHDLHGNILKRPLKNFKFRISVYGALIENGQILIERHPKSNLYGFPGGGIDLGEKIEQALIREFQEETGLTVEVNQLVAVTEDFFTHNGEDAHSIMLLYKVTKTGGDLLTNGNDEDVVELKFVPIEKLVSNTSLAFRSLAEVLF